MSDLPQTRDNVVVEEVSLNLLPGSGETENSSNRVTGQQDFTSCCHDKNYRRLTFCSIICGISCIGIYALINSVKVNDLCPQSYFVPITPNPGTYVPVNTVL